MDASRAAAFLLAVGRVKSDWDVRSTFLLEFKQPFLPFNEMRWMRKSPPSLPLSSCC